MRMLEVPRRGRPGQWSSAATLTDDLNRPIKPFNFTRGPVQVRQHGHGPLQNIYDRPGWHAHAVVRRQR